MRFKLVSRFKPAGDQPQAIAKLVKGYANYPEQTLLGITGSGKTFVMAHVIEQLQKPTLVISHNKILAAQLYAEFRELFPQNRVEYFISYYDYYQPESYIPTTDTYIEKDSSVNIQIEKMRMQATASVLSRNDVIIVASISCIYGLGNPSDYKALSLSVKKGEKLTRTQLISSLVRMQYERNDTALDSGCFRVRGDIIDVYPTYDKSLFRIELSADEIENIKELDPITAEMITSIDSLTIFPAKHFVVPESKYKAAIQSIQVELTEWLPTLGPLEKERISRRVNHDIEMLREMGYCTGIENYSRHFDSRKQGEPPFVLLDYFPKDFLLIIDESHRTIPQARSMYKGDYSRKKNLVDYGFRLPSAFDNRPLKFDEFEKYLNHAIFVSATPAAYETEHSGQVAELIIRPTGLVDPLVEVRPIKGQIKNLLDEIASATKQDTRTFITTLTKKQAEDLTDFLSQQGLKVRYMHADVDSLDRIELIRQLRIGEFDVLVGINLLREGLDIPEVSLVAVLDADKEGFLRDTTSLIQTIGRCARNVNGKVILYADVVTKSIKEAVDITNDRRTKQIEYNKKHGITPISITKKIAEKGKEIKGIKHMAKADVRRKIIELDAQMRTAAEKLDFEKAIGLRDAIEELTLSLKQHAR